MATPKNDDLLTTCYSAFGGDFVLLFFYVCFKTYRFFSVLFSFFCFQKMVSSFSCTFCHQPCRHNGIRMPCCGLLWHYVCLLDYRFGKGNLSCECTAKVEGSQSKSPASDTNLQQQFFDGFAETTFLSPSFSEFPISQEGETIAPTTQEDNDSCYAPVLESQLAEATDEQQVDIQVQHCALCGISIHGFGVRVECCGATFHYECYRENRENIPNTSCICFEPIPWPVPSRCIFSNKVNRDIDSSATAASTPLNVICEDKFQQHVAADKKASVCAFCESPVDSNTGYFLACAHWVCKSCSVTPREAYCCLCDDTFPLVSLLSPVINGNNNNVDVS